MQGIKRKRRCEIECKEHILAIQSLKANSSKYDIKLLFCPKFQRQPLPPEHTYPEYNNDGKFYTSAFILGVDRRVLLKNEQQELMDHQKQIRDSLEKHNQLIFPRPTSKHSLCSVCKQHYKNYYYHISSEQHREKIAQSQYNLHIKQLCNIYVDQWEGAEERADEQAEKRAVEEEERRQQIVEMTVQEKEEYSESLLDVQRGEQEDNDGDDEDADVTYNAKPTKKYMKSNFKDDDTIPFTARTTKRSAPEGRVYTSQYLRKKFLFNNPVASQSRAHREREERRYERQRDKIKTQRDHPENTKEFIKISEKEGDFFVIMKAAHAITQTQVEFVWKRTSEKLRKELERAPERGEKALEKPQLSPQKYEKENKKYEIDYGIEDRFVREQRQGDKAESRPYGYYPYPHYPPYIMPEYKPEQKQGQYYKSDKKGQQQKQANEVYKHQEKGEGRSPYPYYYSPYMYPPMYEPYHRSDNGNEHTQKEKPKNGQRPYEYPPIPYWPYPPPPCYIPPIQQTHTQQSTLSSKPSGNTASSNPYSTSININFPMYMYPPPPIPSTPYSVQARYPSAVPHHPYLPYHHPYPQNQSNGKEEDNHNPNNVNQRMGPSHLSASIHQPQIPTGHPLQGQSSLTNAQPYRSYPPYLNQYHYSHQPQPAQHSISSK